MLVNGVMKEEQMTQKSSVVESRLRWKRNPTRVHIHLMIPPMLHQIEDGSCREIIAGMDSSTHSLGWTCVSHGLVEDDADVTQHDAPSQMGHPPMQLHVSLHQPSMQELIHSHRLYLLLYLLHHQHHHSSSSLPAWMHV